MEHGHPAMYIYARMDRPVLWGFPTRHYLCIDRGAASRRNWRSATRRLPCDAGSNEHVGAVGLAEQRSIASRKGVRLARLPSTKVYHTGNTVRARKSERA